MSLFQIKPLRYFPVGGRIRCGTQAYYTNDMCFYTYYRAEAKEWSILCSQRLRENHPHVLEAFKESSLGHARFHRRRDALEALQTFLDITEEEMSAVAVLPTVASFLYITY